MRTLKMRILKRAREKVGTLKIPKRTRVKRTLSSLILKRVRIVKRMRVRVVVSARVTRAMK